MSLGLYRTICIVALCALSGIIVTGAAVRLTGSGLGCSDWPTCEEGQFFAALEFEPMVEFINRLITGIVSVAVMAAVAGSLLLRPRRRDLTRWSLALVAGVAVQAIIGAFVTKTELAYSVVAVHFLASMVLVWAATVLVERAGRPADAVVGAWAPWAKWLVLAGSAVLLTGPVITSAGPHAGDEDVKRLPLDLAWAARLHSTTVWILCALVAWIAWTLRRHPDARLRRGSSDLLAAVVLQGGLGYLQYFTGVPALLVGLHVAGATLVWILALRLALASTRIDEPSGTSEKDLTLEATT